MSSIFRETFNPYLPSNKEEMDKKVKRLQIILAENGIYDYEIIRVLGIGGFAVTYLAKTVENPRYVVIKILSRRKDYIRELNCLQKVMEEGLCGKDFTCIIKDFVMVDGDEKIYIIVTDYDEGYITSYEFFRDLETMRRKRLITRKEIDEIEEEFQDKVYKLYWKLLEHKILHNDLSEGNILINPKTLDIKIIDFGICHYGNLEIVYLAQNYIGDKNIQINRHGI
jgi:serine/threonine protein kinase